MSKKFVNYTDTEFLRDLTELEDFCSELSQNDSHHKFYGSNNIFSKYDDCFSFYFFQKLTSLYSSDELNIQAYRSNSKNFQNRTTKLSESSARFRYQMLSYLKVLPKIDTNLDLCQFLARGCF